MSGDNILQTVLCEVHDVRALKIPPGEISLSKWNLDDTVWHGSLRLVEQEVINEELGLFSSWNDAEELGKRHSLVKPYESLRLKIELYNKISGADTTEDVVWAEVWFNPSVNPNETVKNEEYIIANNGQETVQISNESPKYYKIIAQLPGTGYHPLKDHDPVLLQVALGLRFASSDSTTIFSEGLNLYRRRYKNIEDQYEYELKLYDLEQKLNQLTLDDLSDVGNDERGSDDIDNDFGDDFGDFVSKDD